MASPAVARPCQGLVELLVLGVGYEQIMLPRIAGHNSETKPRKQLVRIVVRLHVLAFLKRQDQLIHLVDAAVILVDQGGQEIAQAPLCLAFRLRFLVLINQGAAMVLARSSLSISFSPPSASTRGVSKSIKSHPARTAPIVSPTRALAPRLCTIALYTRYVWSHREGASCSIRRQTMGPNFKASCSSSASPNASSSGDGDCSRAPMARMTNRFWS